MRSRAFLVAALATVGLVAAAPSAGARTRQAPPHRLPHLRVAGQLQPPLRRPHPGPGRHRRPSAADPRTGPAPPPKARPPPPPPDPPPPPKPPPTTPRPPTSRRRASTSPTSSRPTAAHIFAIAQGALQAIDARAATPQARRLAQPRRHLRRPGPAPPRRPGAGDLPAHSGHPAPEPPRPHPAPPPASPPPPRRSSASTAPRRSSPRSASPTPPRCGSSARSPSTAPSSTRASTAAPLASSSPPTPVRSSCRRPARLAGGPPAGSPSARCAAPDRRTTRRRLVSCHSVRRPSTFSGLGTLTVLTIDLDKGLPAVDSDALMTDAQTVYASATSLYVATQRWIDPDTPINRAARTDPSRPSIASTPPTPTGPSTRRAATSPATCSTSSRSPRTRASCAPPPPRSRPGSRPTSPGNRPRAS